MNRWFSYLGSFDGFCLNSKPGQVNFNYHFLRTFQVANPVERIRPSKSEIILTQFSSRKCFISNEMHVWNFTGLQTQSDALS